MHIRRIAALPLLVCCADAFAWGAHGYRGRRCHSFGLSVGVGMLAVGYGAYACWKR